MQVALKIMLTAALFAGICAVWYFPIDVPATISKVLPFSIRKEARLDIDVEQIMGAQYRGAPCLLFYVLRFVNTSGENVTVKEISLRLKKPTRDFDSTVLTTGDVDQHGEKVESIIVLLNQPPTTRNLVLMNWKNLRPILAEYKTLSPGAVLAGSAAFVMNDITKDQFKQIKTIEVIAMDYAGNESKKELDVKPDWIKQLDIATVADRKFSSNGQQTIWK